MLKNNFWTTFRKDQAGATAVEYGLIISMVVLAMVGALQGVANENADTWSEVEEASVDAMNR